MPEATCTRRTPLVRRAARKSSTVGPWSASSSLQTVGWMHDSRRQTASTSGFEQRMRYMFAVGPPRSLIVPLNSGSDPRRSTSPRIEASERFWIVRPWCRVIEQKVQPPKQPRMIVTESRIIAWAGTGSLYCVCAWRVKGWS